MFGVHTFMFSTCLFVCQHVWSSPSLILHLGLSSVFLFFFSVIFQSCCVLWWSYTHYVYCSPNKYVWCTLLMICFFCGVSLSWFLPFLFFLPNPSLCFATANDRVPRRENGKIEIHRVVCRVSIPILWIFEHFSALRLSFSSIVNCLSLTAFWWWKTSFFLGERNPCLRCCCIHPNHTKPKINTCLVVTSSL